MNSNVNFGLWVIIMCGCRFIQLLQMFHSGADYRSWLLIMEEALHVLEQEVHGKHLYLTLNFASKKVFLKREERGERERMRMGLALFFPSFSCWSTKQTVHLELRQPSWWTIRNPEEGSHGLGGWRLGPWRPRSTISSYTVYLQTSFMCENQPSCHCNFLVFIFIFD